MPAGEVIRIRVTRGKDAGYFVLGTTYGLQLNNRRNPKWYGVAVAIDLVEGIVTFEKAPDA